MSVSAAFRLRKVTRVYGTRAVVNVESLEIRRGEIYGIVGPSGSGKSTLLRMLAMVESPTSGEMWFDEKPITPVDRVPVEIRRRVTMVFQRPILLSRTVHENVMYGLRLRGRNGVNGRVDEVLSDVGLEQLSGTRARSLSGGELQRVALARAIVVQPDVLLLDEPTANLDPYNVGLIEGIVTRLNRESGTTIVLVTHNVFQARRLAHRAGLLLDGCLIESGAVSQFFAEPTDPRTAAFVRGDMVY